MRLDILLVIGVFITQFWGSEVTAKGESTGEFKVLYEERFDKEIEQVVFNGYEENGHTKFYPKVIVFKELDKELSQDGWRFYKKEVRVYNQEGKIIECIPNLKYYSKVFISKTGNYMGVYQEIPRRPEPYHPSKLVLPGTPIEQASLTMYNDKGNVIWEKEGRLVPYYDASYDAIVSDIDGSFLLIMDYSDFTTDVTLYATANTKEPRIVNKDKCKSDVGLSEIWKYLLVAGFQSSPIYYSENLPNKRISDKITLIDSLTQVIWDDPFSPYIIDRVVVSPQNSYIFARGHTKVGKNEGLPATTGYIYDRWGNILMKISNAGHMGKAVFSGNERYLINLHKETIVCMDLENKKELFRKKLSWPIVSGAVSKYGEIALVTVERKSGESGGTRRSEGHHLLNWQVYLIDKHGNILFKSDEIVQKVDSEVLVHKMNRGYITLGWDDKYPVFGVEEKNKVKSIVLEGER